MKVKWKIKSDVSLPLIIVLSTLCVAHSKPRSEPNLQPNWNATQHDPSGNFESLMSNEIFNEESKPPPTVAYTLTHAERNESGNGTSRVSSTKTTYEAQTSAGQKVSGFSKSTGHGDNATSGGYSYAEAKDAPLNETGTKNNQTAGLYEYGVGQVVVSSSLSMSTSSGNQWISKEYGPQGMTQSIAMSDSQAISGKNKAAGKALSYAQGSNGSSADAGSSARSGIDGPSAGTRTHTDISGVGEEGGIAFAGAVATAGDFEGPDNTHSHLATGSSIVTGSRGAEAGALSVAQNGVGRDDDGIRREKTDSNESSYETENSQEDHKITTGDDHVDTVIFQSEDNEHQDDNDTQVSTESERTTEKGHVLLNATEENAGSVPEKVERGPKKHSKSVYKSESVGKKNKLKGLTAQEVLTMSDVTPKPSEGGSGSSSMHSSVGVDGSDPRNKKNPRKTWKKTSTKAPFRKHQKTLKKMAGEYVGGVVVSGAEAAASIFPGKKTNQVESTKPFRLIPIG